MAPFMHLHSHQFEGLCMIYRLFKMKVADLDWFLI